MKLSTLLCAFGLVAGFAVANAEEAKDAKTETTKSATKQETNTVNVIEVAVMKTSEGIMVFEFWPDVAPGHVENFKKLATKGFYDGTAFHRIMKGFMIQGGDPNTKDPAKEDSYGGGGPGYQIKAEFNDRKHVRGVLSMARSPAGFDTAGSQFFICHGTASSLDGQYTAFGKLIKGDDVLEKLANSPVGLDRRGEPSKPQKRVTLESVKIVPADSIK